MSAILYSVVSHGPLVLCEYSGAVGGNYAQVTQELLEKIKIEKDARMSYVAEGKYSFNYLVRKELVYLCLAEISAGKAVPFAYLDKIARMFEQQHGVAARDTSARYAFNADFAPVLRAQMEFFSAQGSSKLQEVQESLDNVKNVMQENISLVLERGDKLDDLVVQSEGLMDTSANFRSGASRLQQKLWWNDLKTKIIIAAIVVFVLLLLLANACGGLTFPECS
ncbi:Vesicle-associated membrane protein 714 [Hondaea fermentalgiana]|uniref:Vesicle-associated membrane protein 714 n=1 Tax=Hondaea fermentalgiana TaxID=2315210 RepID=A0A2R5G3J0_9STRA|nr:Vesicle-associated membrane protein 714 [Hondaea fermentalgiana]|eukprot:GBG24318.1 Vesicle-associated membrane protein 714 [Hondaea fermentalgiana]